MAEYADIAISGTGAPVLLIHGSMHSKSQWRELTAKLKPCYTVIAVDLHGYGKTPFPSNPDNHRLLDEVALIRRTIEKQWRSMPPLHVVAHSYGGMVALCHACMYPDEVASLALFEPMANHLLLGEPSKTIYDEGRQLVNTIAQLNETGQSDQGAKRFVDYFAGEGVYAMLPSNARRTLAGYVAKMLIDYRTTIETPLDIAAYRGIDCPFTLISGRSSAPISRAIAMLLKSNLENVQWVEIDGNHMAPVSNAAQFNAAIAEHLANTSGRKRCA